MVVFKGLFINNRIKVLGQPANLPPVWVTPEGEIGKARRGEGIGYKLLATDDNTLVRYSVVSGTLPSFLSVTAGGIVTGVVPASATEEDFKPFTVRASDPYGLYADRTFFLTYDAPTPFAPVWNTPSFLGSYPALESMSITVWATADSGATIVSYALAPYSGPLPAGLSIDNTGAIRGSPEMVSNTTNFFFVVRATDSQGRFSDRSFQLAVAYTNTPPKFASNAGRITAGEIGDEIRYQLKATDDKGIVAWNIVAGSLPPGLRLLSSGLIIGKTQPVATTTDYEFAVEVVDEGGLKDTRVFSIRVWAPNAAPVITSPANLGSFPETAQNLRIRLEAEDDRNNFVE
ncbi:MAG: Ig domain-containing protein, partial [Alphaproteobacteria bacterium]